MALGRVQRPAASINPPAQGLRLHETLKIVEEERHQAFVLVAVAAGHVGSNMTARRRPQRVLGRQRFWGRDVEVGGA